MSLIYRICPGPSCHVNRHIHAKSVKIDVFSVLFAIAMLWLEVLLYRKRAVQRPMTSP